MNAHALPPLKSSQCLSLLKSSFEVYDGETPWLQRPAIQALEKLRLSLEQEFANGDPVNAAEDFEWRSDRPNAHAKRQALAHLLNFNADLQSLRKYNQSDVKLELLTQSASQNTRGRIDIVARLDLERQDAREMVERRFSFTADGMSPTVSLGTVIALSVMASQRLADHSLQLSDAPFWVASIGGIAYFANVAQSAIGAYDWFNTSRYQWLRHRVGTLAGNQNSIAWMRGTTVELRPEILRRLEADQALTSRERDLHFMESKGDTFIRKLYRKIGIWPEPMVVQVTEVLQWNAAERNWELHRAIRYRARKDLPPPSGRKRVREDAEETLTDLGMLPATVPVR